MDKKTAAKEIKKLVEEIEKHNYNYYVLSQPTISDKEYDDLSKRLTDLENRFPELRLPTSPFHRVGVKVEMQLPTVTHRGKMYSLDNTYSFGELKDWYNRVKKG